MLTSRSSAKPAVAALDDRVRRRLRPFAFASAGLLALSLAACTTGGNEAPEESTETPVAEIAYPERNIDLIIPFPAGGALDVTYRTLADLASKTLGQTIVVTNLTGASGTVGVSEVASAEPDGYTLGATGSLTVLLQPRVQDLVYEGPQDLTPIFQGNSAPTVLVVAARTGITTIDEFIKATKDQTMTLGLPGGANTIADLQARQLQKSTGALTTVFVEVGQLVPNILNGTFDGGIAQPAVVNQFVETGDLVIIGAFGKNPIPSLPDAPLFADKGVDVDIAYELLYGPAGLPDEIVAKLHDAFKQALDSKEFADYVAKSGTTIDHKNTQELTDQLAEDFKKYGELTSNG